MGLVILTSNGTASSKVFKTDVRRIRLRARSTFRFSIAIFQGSLGESDVHVDVDVYAFDASRVRVLPDAEARRKAGLGRRIPRTKHSLFPTAERSYRDRSEKFP